MDDKSCSCTSKLVTRKCPSWGGRQLQPEFYDSGHKLPVEEAFSHALPSWVFWHLTIHRPQTSHKQHTKEENKRGSGVYVSPSERSRYSSKYIISLDELIVWMLYIAWRSVHGCQFSCIVSHCTFSEYIFNLLRLPIVHVSNMVAWACSDPQTRVLTSKIQVWRLQ